MVRISTFAFLVKNLIRQRALQRLAGRVHLTGTGMALPWPVFASTDLASADIVEDLSMGLGLSDRGYTPILVESAVVKSPAATAAGTLVQRQRWEGGFLRVATAVGPKAAMKALRSRDLGAAFGALDLFVPPVALLAALDISVIALFEIANLAGLIQPWPNLVYGAAFSTAVVGVILVWLRHGREIVSIWDLLLAPIYIVWKIPHYLRLLFIGAPKQWIRGER